VDCFNLPQSWVGKMKSFTRHPGGWGCVTIYSGPDCSINSAIFDSSSGKLTDLTKLRDSLSRRPWSEKIRSIRPACHYDDE
jgi:hypothetical protein